jgi:GMP synthase (glutamine-hydrolysing)
LFPPLIYSPQVAILDFGSQYSHLIARRVRELHVYCELYSCLVSAEELGQHEIIAIVLSGGPSSVYDEGSPHVSEAVWKLIKERNIPVLGICYGMQELAHVFGGSVAPGLKHEYGKATVQRVEGCNSKLFDGMPKDFQMWMSHGDKLTKTPEGFSPVGMYMYHILYLTIKRLDISNVYFLSRCLAPNLHLFAVPIHYFSRHGECRIRGH